MQFLTSVDKKGIIILAKFKIISVVNASHLLDPDSKYGSVIYLFWMDWF
jgi:hypothetical protein